MDGSFLIGDRRVTADDTFRARDAGSGAPVDPAFSISGTEDVAAACALAGEAFAVFRETAPEPRATFLEAIADRIEALGDALVARAMGESGLPQASCLVPASGGSG